MAVVRCEEVQEYLAEHFAGSLSDRLSGTVQSYVRTHMMSCAECCDELEDFEEMQKVLRIIPVAACNADAMRERFSLLIGTKNAKDARGEQREALRLWPQSRPLQILVGVVVLIAAVFAVRQIVKRNSFATIAPAVSAQSSKPVAAPVPAVVQIAIPLATVTGRVLLENGSDVTDVQSLGEIAMSPVGKPSGSSPTIVKLDANGRFSRSLAVGDYRFRVAVFSQDYVIQSVTSGVTDLLKDALIVRSDAPVNVEIRVARKTDAGTGRILGVAVQMIPIEITLKLDTGERLPYKPDTSIVFTGESGIDRVSGLPVVGNLFRASVPANGLYTVAVSNTAAGYSIQSIVDSAKSDLLHGGRIKVLSSPARPPRIVVTLTKN